MSQKPAKATNREDTTSSEVSQKPTANATEEKANFRGVEPVAWKRSERTNLDPRHTTNWVPVPLFEQRPITDLASSARRAGSTFDVARWADRRVLSPVAFEDRWRDLIGACKSPTQFCPPSIRDRKPLPEERN